MEKTQQNTKIKRTQGLKILCFCLVILCLALISFSAIFNLFFHKIWFSVLLFFIGSFLMTRSIFFHLDSEMLFGLLFVFFGISSGVLFFFNLQYKLEIFLSVISLSNLIVYFIFRQNFYIILFALLFLEVLLLIIFKVSQDIYLFWIFQGLYFLVVILIILQMTIYFKER